MSYVDQSIRPDDFTALAERIEPELRRIITFFKVPVDDAEDILQDLFLLFLTQRAQIRTPDAWLAGTLRLRCKVYWRKRRRRLLEAIDDTLLAELAGPVEARQEHDDLTRDLSRAIRKLPDRCRSLIQLRYGLGCDDPEVASSMGYSAVSVRKIASRCLSALTNQILAADQTFGAFPHERRELPVGL